MNMVEKVARAICRVNGNDPDQNAGSLLEPSRVHWQDYAEHARAAIEAMREPTEEMLQAGSANLGDLDVEFAPASETRRGAAECWRDMIDAALTCAQEPEERDV